MRKTLVKPVILAVILFVLTFSTRAVDALGSKAALILAENGRTDFSIAISPRPSPTEEFAARELQRYLGEMSGARFDISAHSAKHFILVCSRKSAPNNIALPAAVASLASEGYCIAARGGIVCVVGADDRGTLYGVYDLLERLGCRWLAPAFSYYQGAHEIVPKFTTLRLSLDGEIVEKSALIYRKLYVEEGRSHTAANLQQLVEWMPKRRFNTLVVPLNYAGAGRVKWDNWRKDLTPELQRRGLWIEVGGHGYENYLNAEMEGGKLFESHPEWFGMDDTGQRSKKPHVVFCTSNPDAKNYFITNVIHYLNAHPEIQIFDFWPPDGAKWCSCAACRLLGTPSDRQALLLSEVSAAVRKSRPDLRFETIAYAACVAPPEKTTLDRRVLVDFCPINQCFDVQINDTNSVRNAGYVAQLKDWIKTFKGDISIYSYYRKYAWRSLPNLLPHYMQNDLRFYASVGVKGVSTYSEPGDWAAYELNHYVLGALAWNPNVDVDRLIQEFSEARFGAQAALGQKAYQLLEENVRHLCSIPFTEMKTVAQYQNAIEAFQALAKEIETARTVTGDKASAAALNRLELTLEYVQLDLALQKAKVENTNPRQREKMSEELNLFLKAHADDGVFLFSQKNTHKPTPR